MPFEIRLLVNICNNQSEYKAHSTVEILKMFLDNSNDSTYKSIITNSLANKYYLNKEYDKAMEVLESQLKNKNNKFSVDELVYLNYTKFLCLFKKEDKNFNNSLYETRVLANFSNNQDIYNLILEKSNNALHEKDF